jgi:hypothetical protein
MPTSYVIRKEQRLVISTASGRVTYDEIQSHRESLLSNPDFDPDYDQVINFLDAEELDLSSTEIRQLARRKIFSAASRRAIVAKAPAIFGIGRMFQMFTEIEGVKPSIEIVGDLVSALQWLGRESIW